MWRERRDRRGFTLLEMAIVVAIFGIMGFIATTLLNDVLPTWRTRRAAMEFMSQLQNARMRATGDGVQYRVVMRGFDGDLTNLDVNGGSYTVEKGDAPDGSETWDILPVDMTSDTSDSSLGTINIASGEPGELPKVSIEEWDTISGIADDGESDIVFSPRGFLDNPESDFASCGGYICIRFLNKVAYSQGIIDRWTVRVSRAGEVKMENDRSLWVPSQASTGTARTSTYTAGAPGFLNGSSSPDSAPVPQ